MDLFFSIVMILVRIGIIAILTYLLVWYLYKYIVQPDFNKFREEQNKRHDEIKELLTKIIDSQTSKD